MIKHLISTTEFVKKICSPAIILTGGRGNFRLRLIVNYVNFISQKPQLSMFVPCDEKGNVLEVPNNYKSFIRGTGTTADEGDKCREFEKAQSKVLFKDWIIDEENNNFLRYSVGRREMSFGINSLIEEDSLENIILYLEPNNGNRKILELTDASLKQIGLIC